GGEADSVHAAATSVGGLREVLARRQDHLGVVGRFAHGAVSLGPAARIEELHAVHPLARVDTEADHRLALADVVVVPGAAATAAGPGRAGHRAGGGRHGRALAPFIFPVVEPVLQGVLVVVLAKSFLEVAVAIEVAGHAEGGAGLPALH